MLDHKSPVGQDNHSNSTDGQGSGPELTKSPTISLPKGGGAIRGIGEKFAANPVTGSGSMSVPIVTSPGRSGFGPQLSLSYDSGSVNGPFGFGWSLSLPPITRKTDKALPQYSDAQDSDILRVSRQGSRCAIYLNLIDGRKLHLIYQQYIYHTQNVIAIPIMPNTHAEYS